MIVRSISATLLFVATLSAVAQNSTLGTTNQAGPPPRSPSQPGLTSTNHALSPIELGEQLRTECIKGRRSICGRILRILPEGLVVESGYTNLLREPLTRSWLAPGTVTASRATNIVESDEPDSICIGTVFLTDTPKGRGPKPRQYDYVIIRGYPTGQYTYTSVGDVRKTVRRFSANLEKAVKTNFAAAEKRFQDRPADAK